MGYGGRQSIRSGDIRRFNFTGNGSNTVFDLGFTPATQNQLIVTVNGLVQHYDAFSISGSTITFDGTPASGDAIQVTAVVDAVGVAAIPDGAIANVSSLAVSGAATFSNTTAHTGAATFANTVAITGAIAATSNTLTVGTAAFFAANGNLGVGTSSPSSKLHVAGGSDSTIRNTASAGSSWFVGSNIDSYILHNESNTPMVLTTNGTERMRIDASGRVTMPHQPSFSAWSGVGDITITTETPLPLNTTLWNVGSHYNTSTYRFTAPVAGKYFFRAHVYKQSSGNASRLRIQKNGSSYIYHIIAATAVNSYPITAIVDMAVSDYVTCTFNSDGGGTGIYLAADHSSFSGYLLG